jgi:hypothetical protein
VTYVSGIAASADTWAKEAGQLAHRREVGWGIHHTTEAQVGPMVARQIEEAHGHGHLIGVAPVAGGAH